MASLGVSLPGPRWRRRGSLWHAQKAGKECLARSAYRPSDVEVLINTGVNRDGHTCEPAIATYVLKALGINTDFRGSRTLGFDLLNGGCGMLNAVQVLATLMQSGQARVGMVVSSEANSDRDPDPAYRYPPSGAAVLLDVAPLSGTGFGAFAFRTLDEHAELYSSVVNMAAKHGRLLLRRKDELDAAYRRGAGEVVEEVLAQGHLARDGVDLVIPAQLSGPFLAELPAAIGLPREKVLDLTGVLEDTLTTSVFLATHHALAARRVGPGKTALLLAFGSGVTVGAATYHF